MSTTAQKSPISNPSTSSPSSTSSRSRPPPISFASSSSTATNFFLAGNQNEASDNGAVEAGASLFLPSETFVDSSSPRPSQTYVQQQQQQLEQQPQQQQQVYPNPVGYSPGASGWYSLPIYHLPSGLLTPGTPAYLVVNPQQYFDQSMMSQSSGSSTPNGSSTRRHNTNPNLSQQMYQKLKHYKSTTDIIQEESSETAATESSTVVEFSDKDKAKSSQTVSSSSASDPSDSSDYGTKEIKERVNEAIASKRNVYIRGLSAETTDETLFSLAARFGNVESSKAILEQIPMKNEKTGVATIENGPCKGYGFVMFSDSVSASKAIFELNRMGLEASFAKESFSEKLKSLQDENASNVYVSNMPETIAETEVCYFFLCLEDLCKSFGAVVMSGRILRDQKGESRGVGFVRVGSRDMAQKVIDNLNGLVLKEQKNGPIRARYADNNAQKKLKTNSHKLKQPKVNQQPAGTVTLVPVYGLPIVPTPVQSKAKPKK